MISKFSEWVLVINGYLKLEIARYLWNFKIIIQCYYKIDLEDSMCFMVIIDRFGGYE
jgi:hypothetical protein